MTEPDASLRGHTVLVTRPGHQAEPLCRLIETAGGTARAIPALEIVPRADDGARADLQTLQNADVAVFVSVNAVEHALALLQPGGMPGSPALAAVGRSTAQALQRHGYLDVTVPEERFDSEGLLQTPLFRSVRGRTVAIVRGEGGREWLADALRRAGARVQLIAVYHRILPQKAIPSLQNALAERGVSLAVISSNAGLENLLSMAGQDHREALHELPLVVLSERTRDFARRLGFTGGIEVAANAENEKIVAALRRLATGINRR